MLFLKDLLIQHLCVKWNYLAVDEVILVQIHGVRLLLTQDFDSMPMSGPFTHQLQMNELRVRCVDCNPEGNVILCDA